MVRPAGRIRVGRGQQRALGVGRGPGRVSTKRRRKQDELRSGGHGRSRARSTRMGSTLGSGRTGAPWAGPCVESLRCLLSLCFIAPLLRTFQRVRVPTSFEESHLWNRTVKPRNRRYSARLFLAATKLKPCYSHSMIQIITAATFLSCIVSVQCFGMLPNIRYPCKTFKLVYFTNRQD